ncbi:homoserine dehydrogenase [Halocynthiibacter sp.]|uniref:homoserine dehydrogenase n=1 Tax=Halocynthiibacter sp. TaxID=1979210 RepID=UPI003C5EC436
MKYRLALIGYGGVARALAEIIKEHGTRLRQEHDLDLSIVAVSDMRLGSAQDAAGLPLDDLVNLPSSEGALSGLPGGSDAANNEAIIRNSNADIVVEATFTNPKTGEPALSHCEWARESGKHLVTTNKGPVALKGGQLYDLAKRNQVGFEFEGAVMSGTPVIRFAKKCLAGNKITGFRGILNGTANYVLGLVEEGASFDDAIKQAQELGYAEADPTADIGGSDVLMKVLILSNQLLGHGADHTTSVCNGLGDLTEEDVRSARNDGFRWKLIGEGRLDDAGNPAISVRPLRLPETDALASVSGPTNAVTFETDLLGDVTVTGPGAGRIETGFALLSDIIAIQEASRPARFVSKNTEVA